MRKLSLLWLAGAAAIGIGIGGVVNVVAQSPGVNSNFPVTWILPSDSPKRTYSYAYQLSPAGQATDIMTLCGASGVQVKLIRLLITARATAVSPYDIYLLKRSSLDFGSGPASSNGIAYDTGESASKASVTTYAANPSTLGTLIGVIGVVQKYMGNLTTGTPWEPAWAFDYGRGPIRAPTLNSATDCLAVNLSGTSQGANLFDLFAEWTEEP